MVYGKVPPQAKELEEAVLGAIMLEKSAFDTIIEILKPECFYVDAHQRIFKSFKSLADKSMPIDLLTVVEELKTKGIIFEHFDMPGAAREGDVHVWEGMKAAWFKDPDGNTLGLSEI